MRPRVGVVGERVTSAGLYEEARNIGRQIAERGAILVCGGLSGVMEAACRGCAEAGGISIGVLPTETAVEANAFVTIPIVTGMGEGRNIIIVRSCQVIIAIGGSFGTLSEIALALRLKIPIIGLRTWEFTPGMQSLGETMQSETGLVRVTNGEQAVEAAWQILKTQTPR